MPTGKIIIPAQATTRVGALKWALTELHGSVRAGVEACPGVTKGSGQNALYEVYKHPATGMLDKIEAHVIAEAASQGRQDIVDAFESDEERA